jgi:hypothetical protein
LELEPLLGQDLQDDGPMSQKVVFFYTSFLMLLFITPHSLLEVVLLRVTNIIDGTTKFAGHLVYHHRVAADVAILAATVRKMEVARVSEKVN